MNAIWRIVLILMLVSVFGNDTALGQGTKGENQFRQQIQNAWNQAGPAIQQARDALAQARAQGINTSAAEAALNKAQSLFQSMLQNPALWSQQQGNQQQGDCVSRGGLKAINPFGDFLFADACIRPDGKLVTRHFDPNGLAARAEEWAKQLKTVNEQMKSLPDAQKASLVADINAALKSSGLGNTPESRKTADQSLGDKAISELNSLKGETSTPPINLDNAVSNPYANDPNVVDLSGSKTLTPKLLREDDSKQFGYPLNVDESSKEPYLAMSDERLEKKREALIKALEETQKLSANNVNGYSQVEADAIAGKEKAWHVVQDTFTTEALGANQLLLKTQIPTTTTKALDVSNSGAGYTVDGKSIYDSIKKKEDGDAIGQSAVTLGGLYFGIKYFNIELPTPLGSIPGAAKLGLDTGLVWSEYYVRSGEYERQEQLRKQLEANRLKLSNQLKEVIEEQNRRNSANPR